MAEGLVREASTLTAQLNNTVAAVSSMRSEQSNITTAIQSQLNSTDGAKLSLHIPPAHTHTHTHTHTCSVCVLTSHQSRKPGFASPPPVSSEAREGEVAGGGEATDKVSERALRIAQAMTTLTDLPNNFNGTAADSGGAGSSLLRVRPPLSALRVFVRGLSRQTCP
jgi:hypothetical protein